jgi:tetratricopeptide (TPR) repeat protein
VNPIPANPFEEARGLDLAGEHVQALEAYRAALEVHPEAAAGWADYGGLLSATGHLEASLEACHRALHLDPNLGAARINLGHALMEQGALGEAEGQFRRVLAREPRCLDARLALSRCLIRKQDLPGAREVLEKALAHDPSNSAVKYWHGRVLYLQTLETALIQEPTSLETHDLACNLLLQEARWEEVSEEIARRQALVPDCPWAAFRRGHLDLLFARMPEGWLGYEARLRAPGLMRVERPFTQPRWGGKPFPGRTLLLHWEQGFGDTLMFVRYAPLVKALGGRVILLVQPALARLVATCPGIDEVISEGAPLPPFDLHLHLLSLPAILRTDLASIPREVPYLDVPEGVPHREPLAEALATAEGATRVGLVWAGNPTHKYDAIRSIPVAALQPLADLPGVVWFSFQVGMSEPPDLPGLVSLAPLLGDFSDTAYALSGMDLVITVDTAVAHLAGALGIPTLLLLCSSPDFRWMLQREDSPWYPSLRIYRQHTQGDWKAVIAQVVHELGDPA